MTLKDIASGLTDIFKNQINCVFQRDELTIEIKNNQVYKLCEILKNDSNYNFEQLIDLCGVDYLHFEQSEWSADQATCKGFSRGVSLNGNKKNNLDNLDNLDLNTKRYAVVYHLLSVTKNIRIRVKTFVEDESPMVDSVVDIWSCADWYEREAFDLYGILFKSHPDLRRILTDYGFIGHPFRKDFPLIGNVEVRYDEEQQRVIYQPVSIEPRTLVPKVIREQDNG